MNETVSPSETNQAQENSKNRLFTVDQKQESEKSLKEELAGKQREVARISESIATTTASMKREKSVMDTYEREKDSNGRKKTELEGRKNTLVGTVVDRTRLIEAKKAEISKLERDTSVVSFTPVGSPESLWSSISSQTDHKEKITQLRQEIAAAETLNKGDNDQITVLNWDIQTTEHTIQTLTAKITEQSQKIGQLQAEKTQEEEKLTEATAKEQELSRQIAEIHEDITRDQKQIADIQDQINRAHERYVAHEAIEAQKGQQQNPFNLETYPREFIWAVFA